MNGNVHCSTINNSQDMEATWLSIDRWVDEDVIYIHNGMLLSHEKEWNNAICGKWMDLEMIMLSELNKYHILSLMWNLKKYKWTYLYNSNRLTDTEKLTREGRDK